MSCVVAIKFVDDLHLSNEDFAKVGGVPLPELNSLELALLSALQFDLAVDADLFLKYARHLMRAL